MGRTIPSFRIALEMEKEEWKPFRNALDKSERKKVLIRCYLTFLEFTYLSACSNSVQLVPLHPIVMSISSFSPLQKELSECMAQVEQIAAKVGSRNKNDGKSLIFSFIFS
jgi:hypothetical protein